MEFSCALMSAGSENSFNIIKKNWNKKAMKQLTLCPSLEGRWPSIVRKDSAALYHSQRGSFPSITAGRRPATLTGDAGGSQALKPLFPFSSCSLLKFFVFSGKKNSKMTSSTDSIEPHHYVSTSPKTCSNSYQSTTISMKWMFDPFGDLNHSSLIYWK